MTSGNTMFLTGTALVSAVLALPAQSQPAPTGVDDHGYVENRGQWSSDVLYRAQFGNVAASIHGDGWTVHVDWADTAPSPHNDSAGRDPVAPPHSGAAIRMRLVGSAGAVARAAGERLPTRINFFYGNDPANWIADLQPVTAVALPAIVNGVDAVVRRQDGHFEYDVVFAAGTPTRSAVIHCDGVDALHLQADGSLLLQTAIGSFVQSPPVAWIERDGDRHPVACGIELVGEHGFRFVAPARSAADRLVVDPGIVWSNVISTGANTYCQGCTPGMDAAGNVYVGGLTTSNTLPTTLGAYQAAVPAAGTQNAWLARFDQDGNTTWLTYLGSTGSERVRTIDVSPTGVVTACGPTSSATFPIVNGFDSSHNGTGALGWGDAWLAQLDPSLSGSAQLTWSTFLGGSDDDRWNSVQVDDNGIVSAAGWTFSTDAPGVSLGTEFQAASGGGLDGMLAQFDPSQPPASQLLYFSYIGGGLDDYLSELLLDSGLLTFYGGSQSTNFPVTAGAFQPTLSGGYDLVFGTMILAAPPAGQLLASTYFGGPGDEADGGAVIHNGLVTAGAWTGGAGFPTTPGTYSPTTNGGTDIGVIRIDVLNSTLVWATNVGGPNDEGANDVVVDPAGGVILTGTQNLGGLPITATAQQPVFGGGTTSADSYVVRLDATGSTLLYSSYHGGTGHLDYAYGLTQDPCGDVLVHGVTGSADFPSTIGSFAGGFGFFISRLDLLPPSVTRFGTAVGGGCSGVAQTRVDSAPSIGNPAFGLAAIGAPPSGLGLLAWANAPLAAGIPVLGIEVWVSPVGALTFSVAADAEGNVVVPLPLPNDPTLVGFAAHTQFVFVDLFCPQLFSSTCALSFTVL